MLAVKAVAAVSPLLYIWHHSVAQQPRGQGFVNGLKQLSDDA